MRGRVRTRMARHKAGFVPRVSSVCSGAIAFQRA
jgi:hypothetical protein